jgi:Phage P22-like portal protein
MPDATYQADAPITRVAEVVAITPPDVRDFLAIARARFKQAVDAENNFRKAALDDLRFLVGDQWPGETKKDRAEQNRPCLTINRMPAIKSQIVNEQRAQRPSTVIRPVGDGADQDTAEIWQGIIRHVEVNSDAEIADDCAFEHMVSSGKGYEEIAADYLPGRTMDQELYIRRIKNPFTVYCDPSSQFPDETDANWKFKICDYTYEEYKQQFPGTALASLSDFSSIGDNFPGWGDNQTVRVAEYWHKEWEDEQLCQLEGGMLIGLKDYNRLFENADPKPKIVKKRKWRKCVVKCDVINGIETIDSYEFPGTVGYIPLVPCIGEDFDVNGERELYGIIRNAKDAQRSINYFRSYAAEVIALAPKAPWVGWKGQFKDGKWQNANVVNYAYLEADMVTTSGQPAPSLPQRNQFEPPIQAILAMSQAVDQDLKAVTGIYEPSLGQTKTDQSGKAIDLLQKQGGLTNLNFTDNLSRMLRHRARVLMDAIPFIYDAPRVQRIIKPDGETNHVIVHTGRSNAAEQLKTQDVKEVYDLSVGTYDVTIDVGPSYQTKRQEAFSMQLQLAQADKSGEILKTCLDIIVGNSDAPGAREMAARLKKLVPPNILDDDGTDPKVALQKAQGQLSQLQQVNTQLMQHNQQMMDEIKTEQVQQQGKLEIVKLQTAAQVEVAGINAKLDAAKLDFQKWEAAHDAAHELAMAQVQNQNDQQAQASQQAHEQTLQESQQQADQSAQEGANGNASSTGSNGSSEASGS